MEYDTSELLKRLAPIRDLSPDALDRLAQKARLTEFRPGLRLEARNEHRWLNYLVDGKINLVSDGKSLVLEAQADRAAQPVFHQDRLRDYAVALTTGRWLQIDRQLFETLRKDETRSGIELEDMELTPTEGEVFTLIYQACLSNSLQLPSMPEVALEIQKASKDPDMDLGRLSRVVQMDLAITGGLIKAANSAMYGGSAPVNNVRAAIQRLGMDTTRQLVMGIAMARVFSSDVPSLQARMHQLWDHSVHVSALSFVLARHCGSLDPDFALLAGLLHDVGVVPILDFIGQRDPDIDPQELERIISRLHGLAGELVVGNWGLGPQICQVVREADQWQRTGGSEADYCDVVQVAQLYAYARQGRTDLPAFESIPAFERLGLHGVCEDGRLDPVDEAQAEINAVMDMLKGA